MAGINTTIQIIDRASQTLRNVRDGVHSTTTAFENAEASGNAFANVSLSNVRNEVSSTNSTVGALTNKVKGLVGAFIGLRTIKGIGSVSDEMTSTLARLSNMTDNAQETQNLFNATYLSAQNARGSVSDLADAVARFGNNARDAFSSNKEVVEFAELVQKSMTIAGASTAEASASMLQLSQALGSGVLRGDELNSIFEQAPNLIRYIADYMGVSIGQIRELASEGKISADIVKNAIFEAGDEINEKFETMPVTFTQSFARIKNTALINFQPVLERLNSLVNTDKFEKFTSKLSSSFATVAGVAVNVFDTLITGANVVVANWDLISPVIIGVTTAIIAYNVAMGTYTAVTSIATLIQNGFNNVLLASPYTWAVLGIIAISTALTVFIRYLGRTSDVADSTFGMVMGSILATVETAKNGGIFLMNIGGALAESTKALGSNVVSTFFNATSAVKGFWYDLLSNILTVIEEVSESLNKLPFVNIDYDGISSKASEFANKSWQATQDKREYKSIGDAWSRGFDTFEYGSLTDAYERGAEMGNALTSKIKGAFDKYKISPDLASSYSKSDLGGVNDIRKLVDNTGLTAKNTAETAKSLEVTSENLKYIRDYAEQRAINRYTSSNIKIDMVNNNQIGGKQDIDGVVNTLRQKLSEALTAEAEGVM